MDLRKCILNHCKADIIVLNETHHGPEDNFKMEDYIGFTHPRMKKHRNSNRYFGGVGVFVKRSALNVFNVSIVDKLIQDLLILLFENKENMDSEIFFLIFAGNLPPENSPYGRNSSEFFGHMLSIIYRYSFVSTLFICGDFNSRIGDKLDYIEEVDNCSKRISLDKCLNKNGENFLEFLKNSNSVVVNGRVTLALNDYTSITTKGKSVVDYIAIPLDKLEYCKKFEILQSNDLIDKLNIRI